jgi:hypothetical protein
MNQDKNFATSARESLNGSEINPQASIHSNCQVQS